MLLPLAISALLFSPFDRVNWNVRRLLLALASTIPMVLYLVLMTFISEFCVKEFSKVLYAHKTEDKEIRYRIYNCGAGDSDMNKQLYVTTEFGPYFYKYKPISRKEANQKPWIKVKKFR